jgi:hypothetical protein
VQYNTCTDGFTKLYIFKYLNIYFCFIFVKIKKELVEPKATSAVAKIKDVLNFIRNEYFEVPFIANYRKEHILPELQLKDLWKIYEMDEKVFLLLLLLK